MSRRRTIALALSTVLILGSAAAAARPAVAAITATLAGTVSTATGPAGSVCVQVYDLDENLLDDDTQTGANGTYTVTGLPAGQAKVQFVDCGNGHNLVSQWYSNKATFEAATPVALSTTTPAVADATLAVGGSISGRVQVPAGLSPDVVCVEASATELDPLAVADVDPTTGSFLLTSLPAGQVAVHFAPCADTVNLLGEWYDDEPTFATANRVTVRTGQGTNGIDATLAAGGVLTGKVTRVGGAAAAGVCVDLADATDESSFPASATTGADGTYQVVGVATGSYKVDFSPCDDPDVLEEWYDDKPDYDSATVVTITAGAPPRTADAVLATAGKVSGKVTGPTGAAVAGVCVTAFDEDGQAPQSTRTADDGTYTVGGLVSGTVKVLFEGCDGANLVSEWWSDKTTFDTADPVSVTAGQTHTGINAQLAVGGTITGRVTVPAPAVASSVCIVALDAGSTPLANQTVPAADGGYSLTGVRPGGARVLFAPCDGASLVPEYYADQPTLQAATVVPVAAGATVSGIDAALLLAYDTAITGGPGNGATIASTTASFAFTGSGGSTGFECRLDAGVFAPCANPTTYTGLAGGAHTVAVRARDARGIDPTPAVRSFTVSRAATPGCAAAAGVVASATTAVSTAQAVVTKATKKVKKAKRSGSVSARKKAKKKLGKAKAGLAAAQTALARASAAEAAAC